MSVFGPPQINLAGIYAVFTSIIAILIINDQAH
jgi:hypothetical protein